jgi:hypothetical protein
LYSRCGAWLLHIPDKSKPNIDRDSDAKTYTGVNCLDVIFKRGICWPYITILDILIYKLTYIYSILQLRLKEPSAGKNLAFIFSTCRRVYHRLFAQERGEEELKQYCLLIVRWSYRCSWHLAEKMAQKSFAVKVTDLKIRVHKNAIQHNSGLYAMKTF